MIRFAAIGLLGLTVACAPSAVDLPDEDSDGDGLLNVEEEELGLDPTNPDSDGDGYTDLEEVDEGTDPLDADEYPGWDNVPTRWETALCDPEPQSTGQNRVGMVAENVVGMNQFGEESALYDYCNKSVLMLIGGFS